MKMTSKDLDAKLTLMEETLDLATNQLGELIVPMQELGVLARACQNSCSAIERDLIGFSASLAEQDTYELEVLMEEQQDIGGVNLAGHGRIEPWLKQLEKGMNEIERSSGSGRMLPYLAILFGILIAVVMKRMDHLT